MSLKEVQSKLKENTVKPQTQVIENDKKTNGPTSVKDTFTEPRKGSVKGNGFVMWYTGSEKRYKRGSRYDDDFPDRLPLEELAPDEKSDCKRFDVKRKLIFEKPPLMLGYKVTDEGLNQKQKEYFHKTLTKDKLYKEEGPYNKNENRLKRYRYVLTHDIKYSLNGLLYYLIPLIINLIFLFLNLSVFEVPENVITSAVILVGVLLLYFVAKSDRSTLKKLLIIVFIALLYAAAYNVLVTYFADVAYKIYPPYVIKTIIIVFGIIWFARYYIIWHVMYVQDLMSDFGNVVKIKCGKPRVGKTSQGVQEVKALALSMWRKLQWDYWKWHSKEQDIIKRGDVHELLEWYSIKESYNFYTKNKGIPCLWSNIGITDGNGRFSYQVSIEHIRGLKRLPLYSVVFFDEIGAVLKNELSLKKGEYYDVSDMFRLGGHFLKWAVIACEQDPNNIYIDCRRVVGANELVKSQTWVCKPVVALAIFNFLKLWKIDNMDKGSKRQPKWAKFLEGFERFVTSIGFRRQITSAMGNLETNSEVYVSNEKGDRIPLGKNRVRYVASAINRYYNDRSYKELYPSRFFEKIEGVPFESLVINGFDLENATQFVSTTERLKELRSALSEKIKEIA